MHSGTEQPSSPVGRRPVKGKVVTVSGGLLATPSTPERAMGRPRGIDFAPAASRVILTEENT